MTYAQILVEMANSELEKAKNADAKGMKNAYAMSIGISRGIIMAIEALGVFPVYDIETDLYRI